LLMKMRSKMQNEKGFTLVELMVVVVILGILVAIAVPVYNNVSDNAKTKACASNIRILEGAIEMVKADNVAADEINADSDDWNEEEAPLAGYLKEWPECPFGDEEYVITAGEVNVEDHFGADKKHL
jgi:type IV pilus assembly protein PilA